MYRCFYFPRVSVWGYYWWFSLVSDAFAKHHQTKIFNITNESVRSDTLACYRNRIKVGEGINQLAHLKAQGKLKPLLLLFVVKWAELILSKAGARVHLPNHKVYPSQWIFTKMLHFSYTGLSSLSYPSCSFSPTLPVTLPSFVLLHSQTGREHTSKSLCMCVSVHNPTLKSFCVAELNFF